MSNLKRVTISDQCTLCGLCEQEEYAKVFECAADGSIQVRFSGLIDVEEHPKLLEAEKLCPAGAILIQDEELAVGDKKEALQKLNDLIYQNLRDYPFTLPAYREYAYKPGVYKASKILADYRSECKYRTYDGAEDAGLRAFQATVWSQMKGIAQQYIVTYRVKELEKYYTYQEAETNYYYQKNKEIEKLLTEAYRLAKFVTDNQIALSEDFCSFEVLPDLEGHSFSRERLEKLEDVNWVYEHTQSYCPLDEYKTYIDVDDYGDDRYYYDFEEAEEEFRKDVDRVVRDLIDAEVPSRVKDLISSYLEQAQNCLLQKVDHLQEELKKHIQPSSQDRFKQEIEAVCTAVLKTEFFHIQCPEQNFDYEYNSECRFYSRRDCEKAGENRRERAYEDGLYYIQNLPNSINDECMKKLGEVLTQWKRLVLRTYDAAGKEKSRNPIFVKVGDSEVKIDLNNFDNVDAPSDSTIKDYISKNILSWSKSVGDVSYMSQYSCKIEIYDTCDFKETIFGNFKEVNRRYGYIFNIYEFFESSLKVGQACVDTLNKSDFLKKFFTQVKESFIKSLCGQCPFESSSRDSGCNPSEQWINEFIEWNEIRE